MEFRPITAESKEWNEIIDFADACSWRAGKTLANKMRENAFKGWERVMIARENAETAGYCTVTKTDCIPNLPYTPYIGFVFVGEKFRGNRLSQKLIVFAASYLKELGFKQVYLISDHVNFYEKYGFELVSKQLTEKNKEEKVYSLKLL